MIRCLSQVTITALLYHESKEEVHTSAVRQNTPPFLLNRQKTSMESPVKAASRFPSERKNSRKGDMSKTTSSLLLPDICGGQPNQSLYHCRSPLPAIHLEGERKVVRELSPGPAVSVFYKWVCSYIDIKYYIYSSSMFIHNYEMGDNIWATKLNIIMITSRW